MRKIITREEQKKKDERNKKVIVIVLGIIMLFSIAGYFVSDYSKNNDTSQTVTYNGIKFIENDYGYWGFSVNGVEYQTRFNPNDVENVTINLTKAIGEYKDKPLYFGINSQEDIYGVGISEIRMNLDRFVQKTDYSCIYENCTEDHAIKNCLTDNVIIFKQTNNSKIFQENGCTVIQYISGDSGLTSDAFLFRILGIK